MACYQLRTFTQDLAAVNLDLLKKALEGAGYVVKEREGAIIARHNTRYHTLTIKNGQVDVTYFSGLHTQKEVEADINKLRQAYSREAIQYAARKFGMNVTINQKAANKMTLKGRF